MAAKPAEAEIAAVESPSGLLPYVRDLREGGGFHPAALFLRDALEAPAPALARSLAVGLGVLVLALLTEALAPHLGEETALLGCAAFGLPLHIGLVMAAWRDRLERSRDRSLGPLLERWGGTLAASSGVLLLHLGLLDLGTRGLWQATYGGRDAWPFLAAMAGVYLGLSLSWAHFLAGRILREEGTRRALRHLPHRCLESLVAAARLPTLARRLARGEPGLEVLPYLVVLAWVAAALGLSLGAVLGLFPQALLGGRLLHALPASFGFAGAAFGLEGVVGLAVYAYVGIAAGEPTADNSLEEPTPRCSMGQGPPPAALPGG